MTRLVQSQLECYKEEEAKLKVGTLAFFNLLVVSSLQLKLPTSDLV